MSRVAVSACLLGRACRYDGGSSAHPQVEAWAAKVISEGGEVIGVCPEEAGGLGTPRPAAELRGGGGTEVLAGAAQVCRVDTGEDVTAAFVEGAKRSAEEAGELDRAVLKARSPSCGCGAAWQDGEVRAVDGVFAALLRSKGIPIGTEEAGDRALEEFAPPLSSR